MSDLKPCPFCGGHEIEVQIVDIEDREGVPKCRICECGAAGPWVYVRGNDLSEIDSRWNTRPSSVPVEALRELIEESYEQSHQSFTILAMIQDLIDDQAERREAL